MAHILKLGEMLYYWFWRTYAYSKFHLNPISRLKMSVNKYTKYLRSRAYSLTDFLYMIIWLWPNYELNMIPNGLF